jgi:uncharacterized damage-inducible protein DinB
MNTQEVRTFFAYTRWAHRRLLRAVGELSPEELDRDLRASFTSIKGTLRHLVWGERGWLRFWRRESFGPELSPAEFPDLPSIVAAWAELEKEQDAFTSELSDEKLAATRHVDENSYLLGELVQHMLNHSTHHLGQITLMLRQLGRTPPNTGFRQFLTESRRGA